MYALEAAPVTTIKAIIPKESVGEIVINDVVGRRIMEIPLTEPENSLEINGNNLGFGVFFYSLYMNLSVIQNCGSRNCFTIGRLVAAPRHKTNYKLPSISLSAFVFKL